MAITPEDHEFIKNLTDTLPRTPEYSDDDIKALISANNMATHQHIQSQRAHEAKLKQAMELAAFQANVLEGLATTINHLGYLRERSEVPPTLINNARYYILTVIKEINDKYGSSATPPHPKA